ncbi:PKD domain-containing protein, partial [Flavobacteriaceae bacterium]|nr:PKD domain-containing protein [Flavobacteriaceae bacterium]
NAATSTINTAEGCSSISDFNGNLLFYSDGRNVWDKNHQIMPNANYRAGSGLLGDPSSTSSALIVPRPGNPDHYYVFTVDEPHHNNAWAFPNQGPANRDGTPLSSYSEGVSYTIPSEDDGYNNGLNYSLLDLTLNSGNGDIDATEKNLHLLTYDPSDPDQEAFKCSEKITAVKHNDGQSYWVLSHFMDVFYAFRVNASGVNTTPVTTQITPNISINGYRRNAIGYMKSSPDGTKLVISHTEQGTSQGEDANNTGSIWIYDFDDATGTVSNPVNIINNTDVYGTAFSPDSSKLYTTGSNSVLQFDLEATDVPVTRTSIYTGSRFIAAIQLAPNGKIYAVNTANNVTLDVINSPNELGALCDYNASGQSLAKGTYTRLGLPPFIQSFFLAKIEVENLCFGEVVKFTIDSSETYDRISWDFGDGSSPSTADSPTHTYSSAGNYTVMVTLQIGITTKTFSKTFTVTQTPDAINVSLVQCDEDGVYDGKTLFNLNQVYDKVTNNFTDRNLKFYQNRMDAEMDASNNISGEAYVNSVNPEQLYVQVLNIQTGCYSVAELILKVGATTGNDATLELCDTDGTVDGEISFNLRDADALILKGLPSSSKLNYYVEYQDVLLETNALSNNFTNTIAYNQTIFARIENDNDCYGINQLKLVVHSLPEITPNDENLYCLNTYPNRITI